MFTKYEFHVHRAAREKYQIEHSLFSISGDIIIANFRQARILAKKINDHRSAAGEFNLLVGAGQINALGLMHEIFHYLIHYYEEKINPGVFTKALNTLKTHLTEDELDKILLEYIKEFPALTVYTGKEKPEEYLKGNSGIKPNREIILEEIILLNLENINPAAYRLEELFTDKIISQKTNYPSLIERSETFFNEEKSFGEENVSLISFLKKPIVNSPHNIEGQLEFIIKNWGIYIPEKLKNRLLGGLDLITEDLKIFLQIGFGPKPTPPVPVYKYDEEYLRKLREKLAAGKKLTRAELDYYNSGIERFTKDLDWMPKVVMIAKNAFVWLDQLSKKYNRRISRLDEIPDEELDQLRNWNFTALWLIGVWERSNASRKIKQLTGNPEAAASAYSLYDYEIASELGGEDSFQNLKRRAWLRGIRLASDMVPNHTGIYSKWVIEKPDNFIQTSYPPFPGYTFLGPNLSDDARVEIRIEDKYYSREDAAVVFQRRDSYTGDVKYIYHGNDGTHMPWNDTAQLNLMKPEVREDLIQTIMHIAKKFPIIRFDAAMTLAKKHYQRLWFPQPGSGGAIPSRSDFAMSDDEFNEAMPNEFWREVVDRMNAEMPDTLLLAEAFWLMEGYFVRSLGMHRVYNSAFMHMMMKEENNKFRELIKNTLDFNPEILKRYVNFMSNPDEETAVNQFGKGDKYFGVAVMMVTLPGLPMFGHGQVEGLSEKYGMEYKKAYYNETADLHLINRHEAEVFPLMNKRYLFSQVVNFEFYDFIDEYGNVNENVFAFTNMYENERALVVYNNAYSQCKGYINYSVIKAIQNNGSNFKRTQKLADALLLKNNYKYFYIYRDHKTKLEFIKSGEEIYEKGLFFTLDGYNYKILVDFKEIIDMNGEYENLSRILDGKGVNSIEEKLKEIKLAPLYNSFLYLLNGETLSELNKLCFEENSYIRNNGRQKELLLPIQVNNKIKSLLSEIKNLEKILLSENKIVDDIITDIKNLKYLFSQINKHSSKRKNNLSNKLIHTVFNENSNHKMHARNLLFVYLITNRILHSGLSNSKISWNEFSERINLEKILISVLQENKHEVEDIFEKSALIKALISKEHLWNESYLFNDGWHFISKLIDNEEVSKYLLLNEFGGIIYFNKERFENLLEWVHFIYFINKASHYYLLRTQKQISSKSKESNTKSNSIIKEMMSGLRLIDEMYQNSQHCGYNLIELKNILKIEIETSLNSKAKKKNNTNRDKAQKENK